MAGYGARVTSLLEPLRATIARLSESFDSIPAQRRATLEQVSTAVRQQLASDAPVRLLFICTHNSRRSHLGQAWAAAAAAHYGVEVQSFSGGTEATAFNPHAVGALRALGFDVSTMDTGPNPHYQVRFAQDAAPCVCFSKVYDDDANPNSGFIALMTCSDADEACPNVPGAILRVATPYDDPKMFDGQTGVAERYIERAEQIGTELLYTFSRVA